MKKLLSLFVAAVMVFAMALPVMAAEGGTEHRYRNDDSIHTPDSEEYLHDGQSDGNTTSGTPGVVYGYDASSGESVLKFNKYFITNIGSSEPTVKFDFTIEPGTAIPYELPTQPPTPPTETGTFEVMKPIVGERTSTSDNIEQANVSAMPKFKAKTNQVPSKVTTENDKNTVTFTDTSTTKIKKTAQPDTDYVHLDKNEWYQKEVLELDFTGVYFYEPGIYRYVIKEEATPTGTYGGVDYTKPSGLYLDTQEIDTYGEGTPKVLPNPSVPVIDRGSKTRILDVYVTDTDDDEAVVGEGTLRVKTFILHELVGADPTSTDPTKKIGKPTEPTLGNEAGTNTQDYGTDDDEIAQKSDGFVNEYHTVDLDVKKEVQGNQASRDKYFKLTVFATDVEEDVEYILSLAPDADTDTHDGSCDIVSGKNAATIADNEGKNNYEIRKGSGSATDPYVYKVTGKTLMEDGFPVYLQHGQHIVIRGLPETASYYVEEEPEDYKMVKAEDYTTAYNVANYWNATDPATDTRAGTPLKTTLKERDKVSDVNGTDVDDDEGTQGFKDGLVRTSFLNVRDGIIPTGVAIGIFGGLALLAAVIVYVVIRRRTAYEED